MTTHFLRIVADRLDSRRFPPPKSIDLPGGDGQPAVLRFHDISRESLGPWLHTFGASLRDAPSARSIGEGLVTVETWVGHCFGSAVEIKLYEAP